MPFQVYRLPFGVMDIYGTREKISQKDYEDLRTEVVDSSSSLPFPRIYIIWSTANEATQNAVMDYASIVHY